MKPKKRMEVLPVLLVAALSVANLLHLLWTVWLTIEQIKTGWNGGTGMEMLALLPWMLELLCMPVILAAVIYLVLSFYRRQSKGLLVANSSLFALLLLQIGLTNLFLFY